MFKSNIIKNKLPFDKHKLNSKNSTDPYQLNSEQESDIFCNLREIEQNSEKYFGDVNELKGGDFKDILSQKVNFKWNNQFQNYDFYRN